MKVIARALLALIVGIGLLVGGAGCDNQEEEPAQLRVINAAPGAGPIDFFIDFELFTRSLSFRNATTYLRWDPGLRRLEARAAGSQTASVTQEVLIAEDQARTIIVAGSTNAETLLLIDDDRATLPGSQTRLRAVHAAPTVGSFTITAQDESGASTFNTTLSSLGGVSPFFPTQPGTYTIEIRPPSGAPITLTQTMNTGIRYLLVVTNSVAFIIADG